MSEFQAYKRAVLIIVWVISMLCVCQSLYALLIGNRFLLKDALDWGYDVVLWLVALWAFGRGEGPERLAALAIALVMAVAGLHTGYDLWDKIVTGRRPELWVAGWSSFTMIGVALLLLALMLRFRRARNTLIAATWLSSRNSIIITLGFAAMSFFARSQSAQIYEIALDGLAIALSFQSVYAILSRVLRAPDNGQAAPGVASSGHITERETES